MYKYAQINEAKICFSIAYLSGEVIQEDMILLKKNEEVLGYKWNGESWEYVEPKPQPIESTEKVEVEKYMLDLEYRLSKIELGLGGV